MLKTICLAALNLLVATRHVDAQSAQPDWLLDRLIGNWVLQGRMAGKQTVQDVSFQWVLGYEYVVMHEATREKNESGAPAYEAIVYIGRDPKTHEYAALWLDNTAYGAFKPAGTGHGFAAGDSIPFLFVESPTSRVHTTFKYNRASDEWEWHMDDEDAGVIRPFARVTLTRKRP